MRSLLYQKSQEQLPTLAFICTLIICNQEQFTYDMAYTL